MNQAQIEMLAECVVSLKRDGVPLDVIATQLVLLAAQLRMQQGAGVASAEAQRSAAEWVHQQADDIAGAADLRLRNLEIN